MIIIFFILSSINNDRILSPLFHSQFCICGHWLPFSLSGSGESTTTKYTETTVALSFFVRRWEVACGLKGHSSNKISTFGKTCCYWDMGNGITLLQLPLYVHGESDIQTDTLVSLIQMWHVILTGVPSSWFFVFSQFRRVITRLIFLLKVDYGIWKWVLYTRFPVNYF